MNKNITIKIQLAITGVFFIFVSTMIACYNNPAGDISPVGNKNHKGIDTLMSNLSKMKKEEVFASASGLGDSVEKLSVAQEIMNKTSEELREELLSGVSSKDRGDFEHELETIFETGEHKGFFLRQVSYCKIRLDLAVVGMGIVRVHEVLKGENPAVRKKDKAEFIKYVKDQVQQGVAAQDKNYKTIVFKGLESSID